MLQSRSKIRKDAGRRDGRARARPADDQRVVAVAARHELHDVVGEADVRERMLRRERLADRRCALPARTSIVGDVAQHLPGPFRACDALRHRRVEVRQALQELVDRSVR